MKRQFKLEILVLGAVFGLMACGKDADEGETPVVITEQDQGSQQDMGQTIEDMKTIDEEDIPSFGDDIGMNTQDEARRQTIIKEWPLHMKTAPEGSVNTTAQGSVFSATIDAAAGGSQASRENPFVYLDLETGEQVMVDDIGSLDNTAWELGFKRTAIRTNSADSGKGHVMLAKLSNTTFEAVTQAPADVNVYTVDETLNAEGELRTDPIGTPYTAFNYLNLNNPTGSASWYSYAMGVSPVAGDIYIVKSATSETHFKLEIQSWTSGVYTIRWSAL